MAKVIESQALIMCSVKNNRTFLPLQTTLVEKLFSKGSEVDQKE